MAASEQRSLRAGVAAAVGLYLLSAWPTLRSVVDDAYVSARYALHLAHGDGLVYNAGQPPVEGYTNFLWVVLLAPGMRLPLHPATWMTGLGLAFGALSVVAMAALVRTLAPDRALPAVVAAGAWALLPWVGVATTNGLETALWLALLLLAARAALRGDAGAGVLAGLLYLVRPEGILVGGVLAGSAAVRRRDARPLLEAAAVGVPYFLGRTAWFGTLVPNTWHAQARGPLAEMWAMNRDYLFAGWPLWVGLAAMIPLLFVGPRRLDRLLLAALAAALAVVAFRVFNWMPGLRLWLAPAALLLAAAAPALSRPALVLVAAAWVGWLQLGPRAAAVAYDGHHTVLPDNGGERLGRAIAAAAPPGSWLLVRDAGVTAWFAGPAVNVLDIHPYSLTEPRLTGQPADLDFWTDRDVSFVVTTAKTRGPDTAYPVERSLLQHAAVRGRFLRFGTFRQHHRRFYVGWVRADLRDRVPFAEEDR